MSRRGGRALCTYDVLRSVTTFMGVVMSTVGRSWLKLVAYAAWGALNVVILVTEFMRDDARWWRVALSVIFIGVSVGGVLDQARALRTRPAADSRAE